jgi:hypothetical protein
MPENGDDQDRVVSRRVRNPTSAGPDDENVYRAAEAVPDERGDEERSDEERSGAGTSGSLTEAAAEELAEENASEPTRSE